jgi:hypothetical protein
MKTSSSIAKHQSSSPEAECEQDALRVQEMPRGRARTSAPGLPPRQELEPSPGREHLIVAVLRLLSPNVRERFCYVALVAALLAFGMAMLLAPTVTLAGASAAGMVRLLVKKLGG